MKNDTKLNTQLDLGAQEGEILISDILGFLRDSWGWFASGAIVGVMAAVCFLLFSPTQYEATVVIQPATVGLQITAATTTATTKGVDVESVAQTLERLKIATFYTPDIVQTCQAPSSQALATGVKSNLVRGNSLIQLAYRSASKAVAEACVNAIVSQLVKSQTTISEPLVKTLKEQLAQSRLRLGEAREFQAQLERRAAAADTPSLLMLNALAKREEIARLQKQVLEQEIQLSPPLTQPLQLLEPIYAPDRSVFPNTLFSLAGGLFGGLVLGGLLFFGQRSWAARYI